jgi:serine phosphatase RsbU (regulator of sigma subunit)
MPDMDPLNNEELIIEKQRLDQVKLELEQKNKQMWAMSETVYKEKKKIEEQLRVMLLEKEELEKQKKENEEKVKLLWEQSSAIHHEKERINALKAVIEQKHHEIVDSVNYAQKIQEAILPDLREIAIHLPETFILFKPRDIVSGDFYWFSHKNNRILIAAVDCTGHGVPGAFMSMIGNTLLNQIVNERGLTDPGQILHQLNEEVNISLKQTQEDSESRDGMDIAICSFAPDLKEVLYAGANRPLYIIKNNQLQEIKANKFAIGGRDYDTPKKFETRAFNLEKNDTIYLSSDGYADQFSPFDKKLMTRKFRETLLEIQNKTMPEQKEFLNTFIDKWKDNMEQTDDILVIGVRV